MAIYNASLLISASNATYFTNVTGGIAAVAVRGFNDTWISSSALLTGSNTFVGNQIISGNVDINGTITASLQTGYLYVGDGSGRTQAVATSSIITNIATGSFATTGSNTFYGDQIISGNVLPLVNGQGDIGNDTYKWNKIVVNGELKGSSLNTTGRGAVGTLRVGDETFPLSFLSDREIVGDGSGANTHLYYGTSSADVTALREFVYAQSGSDADFTSVSASFNTRINSVTSSIDTGSFATTGSNTFTGNQYIYSTSGATPLVISSSAYYGIQLQNQGIQITGNAGPRIQFPNATWLNGNENDNFQFTGDTDNPLTRGLDFYLYGSGSRAMNFRNNSGPGGGIQFSTSQSAITFNAGNNIGITAGNTLSLTGSQTNINGLRYPQTDGTNGQALITNGSGILSFGNVSINTGSFATTGSNSFNGDQNITGSVRISQLLNFGTASLGAQIQSLGTTGLQVNAGESGSFSMRTLYGAGVGVANIEAYDTFPSFNFGGKVSTKSGGGVDIVGYNGAVNITGSSLVMQGFTYPTTDGTAGQVLTTNGSKVLSFTTVSGSGGATGSFATLGANLFTGSQTIQSGSQIIFNGLNGSSNDNGLVWGTGTPYAAKLFYQSGSGGNFLQFQGDVGIDFSVGQPATANSNINFRTQNAAGQIQFTSDSSSISLKSGTTTTISASRFDVIGVETIGANTRTSNGESYLLGYSGSLVLGNSVNSATYAALSHISSSQPNGNTNLIFKTNSNTGTTIVSGSANIFTNPAAPTAGFKRYIGGSGNIALNANNITLISGSMGFSPTMSDNYFSALTSPITMRGPVSSSAWTISNNIVNQAVNIGNNAANNAEKIVAGLTIRSNIFNNSLSIVANKSLLTQELGVSNNQTAFGATTLTAASSSIQYQSNLGGGIQVVNSVSGGAASVSNLSNAIYLFGNMFGGQGNIITASGSSDPGDTTGNSYLRHVELNQIFGTNNGVNLPYAATGSNALVNTMIAGFGLAITGSSPGSFSGLTQLQGSAFFGRWNAQDGNKAQSAQTIFAIGAGTSTARKTAFLIDSGSNTFVEGSLNVSGSSSMTGSLIVSSSNSIDLQVIGTAQVSSSNANTLISANNLMQTDNANSVTNNLNTYGFSTIFGTGGNAYSELGFTNNGASYGISGWNGPSIYINDPSDLYPAVFGFQQKSDYTDGRVTALTPLVTSGSLIANSYAILSSVSSSLNFADDTAAAAGGVPLGGLYRNGNFVMIRLT